MKKISKRTSGSPKPSRGSVATKPSAPARRRSASRLPPEPLDAIVAFADLATRERLRWYLFGAQAVAAYGVPRTTGDVDVTVELLDRGLATLVTPLRRAGFVPMIVDEAFAIETRVYPVMHKPTGWSFDLVLAGPGLEQRFLDEARMFPAGRRRIPVIAPEYLVTLKILAGRPKDLEDVRGMLRLAVLDHVLVDATLAELEAMLDQGDLRPVYARLRAEHDAKGQEPGGRAAPGRRRRPIARTR